MKANRREFIATAAGALATMGASRALAQPVTQPKINMRTLKITFEGLAVISVSKPLKAPQGLPGLSSRVDVLFLEHAEHTAPHVFDLNDLTASGLPLGGAELVIKVGNTVLRPSASGVGLDQSADSCTAGNWNGMRNLPEFERILEGRVDVLPSAFGPKPDGVSGRITIRRGGLTGEVPVGKYPDFEWYFPGAPKTYVKAFTDHVTWTTDIPAGDVTLEAIPFAGGKAQTFTITGAGDVALIAGSGRTTTPPTTTIADHFEHYYHLLAYAGTLKPIPNRGGAACGKGKFTFTQAQEDRFKQFQEAGRRFRSLKQEDDCGATEVLRGEPGICINGIAYSTAP